MSTDLQWLLVRNYNSFLVKRVREGPVFSKEPGNLRNLHSHKYSGLANSKDFVPDNRCLRLLIWHPNYHPQGQGHPHHPK
ncbi:hypothetical protein ONZ45_g11983 [Pleurotus djamor]|nr:hypothetical protein ONZ45_g11983 [Pleurotus djamor]